MNSLSQSMTVKAGFRSPPDVTEPVTKLSPITSETLDARVMKKVSSWVWPKDENLTMC